MADGYFDIYLTTKAIYAPFHGRGQCHRSSSLVKQISTLGHRALSLKDLPQLEDHGYT